MVCNISFSKKEKKKGKSKLVISQGKDNLSNCLNFFPGPFGPEHYWRQNEARGTLGKYLLSLLMVRLAPQ